jgi:hypothetical protein
LDRTSLLRFNASIKDIWKKDYQLSVSKQGIEAVDLTALLKQYFADREATLRTMNEFFAKKPTFAAIVQFCRTPL